MQLSVETARRAERPARRDVSVAGSHDGGRSARRLQPVPRDGVTMGEIFFRGNITMKGYLKNPKATEEAFEGGWYHTGDLAVSTRTATPRSRTAPRTSSFPAARTSRRSKWRTCYTAIRRAGSGGGSQARRKMGGDARALSSRSRPGETAVSAEDIIAFCRERLAGFKIPKQVVFGPLPKTSTGKIQKNLLRDQAKALREHRRRKPAKTWRHREHREHENTEKPEFNAKRAQSKMYCLRIISRVSLCLRVIPVFTHHCGKILPFLKLENASEISGRGEARGRLQRQSAGQVRRHRRRDRQRQDVDESRSTRSRSRRRCA